MEQPAPHSAVGSSAGMRQSAVTVLRQRAEQLQNESLGLYALADFLERNKIEADETAEQALWWLASRSPRLL